MPHSSRRERAGDVELQTWHSETPPDCTTMCNDDTPFDCEVNDYCIIHGSRKRSIEMCRSLLLPNFTVLHRKGLYHCVAWLPM